METAMFLRDVMAGIEIAERGLIAKKTSKQLGVQKFVLMLGNVPLIISKRPLKIIHITWYRDLEFKCLQCLLLVELQNELRQVCVLRAVRNTKAERIVDASFSATIQTIMKSHQLLWMFLTNLKNTAGDGIQELCSAQLRQKQTY